MMLEDESLPLVVNWRRSRLFLAQVRFYLGDTLFPHLHQNRATPAPTKTRKKLGTGKGCGDGYGDSDGRGIVIYLLIIRRLEKAPGDTIHRGFSIS
jgi:hypothetical protein